MEGKMGEFYGASVEELRDLARVVARQGERLEHEIVRGLDQAITISPWAGVDADSFTGSWRSSLIPMLRHASDALLEASRTLDRQATEQERASAGDGDLLPGGFPQGPFDTMPYPILPDRNDWLRDLFKEGFDLTGDISGVAVDLTALIRSGALDGIDLSSLIERVDDLDLGGLDAIPGALQMLSGITGMSQPGYDPFAASDFFQGLLDTGSVVFSGADKVLGGAAGMLGAFTDGAQAYNDFTSGNAWAGAYDAAHGIAAGVGVFVAPVGWCLGAWDAGVGIGTAIGETPVFQSNLDEATQIGLEKVGGDPSKLVERYEGVGGFFNAEFDSIQAWFQ
jgi:hypothetical protein